MCKESELPACRILSLWPTHYCAMRSTFLNRSRRSWYSTYLKICALVHVTSVALNKSQFGIYNATPVSFLVGSPFLFRSTGSCQLSLSGPRPSAHGEEICAPLCFNRSLFAIYISSTIWLSWSIFPVGPSFHLEICLHLLQFLVPDILISKFKDFGLFQLIMAKWWVKQGFDLKAARASNGAELRIIRAVATCCRLTR